MLTQKQISEIREHLEKAQNPLFFFDNDNDGLCSFLLLRRFIDRGRGVAIKGHGLNLNGYRRVDELKPDYVFILDIPMVDKKFLDKIKQDNIPVVWIDHHNIGKSCMEIKSYEDLGSPDKSPLLKKDQTSLFSYYNPYYNDKTNEPVSYLCHKIANRKQDDWIAVIGCISDFYIPDFYPEFEKKYPELSKKDVETPFGLLYGSEIGKIARILDFSLKDKTSNVVKMLKFMMKIQGPMDVLEENFNTKQILKHYNEINSKYQKLIEKAREKVGEKMIYFQYGGDLSLSANLANQLVYEFPKKIVVVAYIRGTPINVSIRGSFVDVLKITLKAIKGLKGAAGGGHEHATGARMDIDDLEVFKKRFEEAVELQ